MFKNTNKKEINRKEKIAEKIAMYTIIAGISGSIINGMVEIYKSIDGSKRVREWNNKYGDDLRYEFCKELHKNKIDYKTENNFIMTFEVAMTHCDEKECRRIIDDVKNYGKTTTKKDDSVKEFYPEEFDLSDFESEDEIPCKKTVLETENEDEVTMEADGE